MQRLCTYEEIFDIYRNHSDILVNILLSAKKYELAFNICNMT